MSASDEQLAAVAAALAPLDGDDLVSIWHGLASDIYRRCAELTWDPRERSYTCPHCGYVYTEGTTEALEVREWGMATNYVRPKFEPDGTVHVDYADTRFPDMELLHFECEHCASAVRFPLHTSVEYDT